MSVDRDKYPALAKMEDAQEESQIVGDFLDWLEENGLAVCQGATEHRGVGYFPLSTTREELLAQRFGLDLKAVERDRQALLDAFNVEQRERQR